MRWYKGNLHMHTTVSDGHHSLQEVADWYKEHGYDFLVITDHNKSREVASYGAHDDFLLIRGNELTTYFPQGDTKRPVHSCALNYHEDGHPGLGRSVLETLQMQIDATRAGGGVPIMNHPNWRWGFSHIEMMQTTNCKLFEVYNMGAYSNLHGGGGVPSHEEQWDIMLTAGKEIYGVATDDFHTFNNPFAIDEQVDGPGRGWVVVQSPSLETHALMEALEAGRFYSSTGVELEDIAIGNESMSFSIVQSRVRKYTTEFIGSNGKILKTCHDLHPDYLFDGSEGYVRARVTDSDGQLALIQPVFIKK